MKQLVEFPLEDGGSILVEVDIDQSEGMEPATPLGDVPRKAQKTFESALDQVRVVAGAVLGKIRALPETPDEVEVEFGIKMDAKAGAIVSSAGVEANFKMTLTWKKEDSAKK